VSLRNRLKRQLRNRQFRHAYADEHLNLSISTQIILKSSQKEIKKKEVDAAFEEFWSFAWRKTAKQVARKSYEKKGADPPRPSLFEKGI
jgi:SOS response regulatory protein OraA/RecX